MGRHPPQKRHEIHEFGTVTGPTEDLRIDRLEDRLAPRVPFPHRHAFYHLVFITKGSGFHEIDFERHRVRANQIFVMRPGQVHSWKLAKNTRGHVIEFTHPSLFATPAEKSIFEKVESRLPACVNLRGKAQIERVQNLLHLLHEEQTSAHHVGTSTMRNVLMLIYSELAKLVSAAPAGRSRDTLGVDAFLDLVDAHFSKEHSVAFYARKLGVSPKNLTMRVSRAIGKSARIVIRDRCLLEAKRLLAYSDVNVSEIGYELGFADPNYFSRLFHQTEKLTPSQFREKSRR